MLSRLTSAMALALLAVGAPANAQTSLTPGNIVVFQAASSSSSNTTASLLELSNITVGQTSPVQTIDISTPTGMRFSGSATSTGYLKTNPNGSITYAGVITTNTTANTNTVTTRGVGVLSPGGAVTLGTTYTGVSGQQPRSAATDNGVNFFIGDQSGIYRELGTAPVLSGNVRGVQIVGGQTYVSSASTTFPTGTASQQSALTPALPSTAGAVTASGLPGLGVNAALQDSILLSSGLNGATVDTLYVSTTAGITKFGLSNGSFVNQGSVTVTGGLFGITAQVNGTGGIDVFATTGTGATGANSVIKFTDATLDPTLTASFGTQSTLFTAGAGTTLKGITFVAPTAVVPEPATVFGIGAAGLGLMRVVRRRKK